MNKSKPPLLLVLLAITGILKQIALMRVIGFSNDFDALITIQSLINICTFLPITFNEGFGFRIAKDRDNKLFTSCTFSIVLALIFLALMLFLYSINDDAIKNSDLLNEYNSFFLIALFSYSINQFFSSIVSILGFHDFVFFSNSLITIVLNLFVVLCLQVFPTITIPIFSYALGGIIPLIVTSFKLKEMGFRFTKASLPKSLNMLHKVPILITHSTGPILSLFVGYFEKRTLLSFGTGLVSCQGYVSSALVIINSYSNYKALKNLGKVTNYLATNHNERITKYLAFILRLCKKDLILLLIFILSGNLLVYFFLDMVLVRLKPDLIGLKTSIHLIFFSQSIIPLLSYIFSLLSRYFVFLEMNKIAFSSNLLSHFAPVISILIAISFKMEILVLFVQPQIYVFLILSHFIIYKRMYFEKN
jgi:hypothetical protein